MYPAAKSPARLLVGVLGLLLGSCTIGEKANLEETIRLHAAPKGGGNSQRMHHTLIAKRPGVYIGRINDAFSVRALPGSGGISIITDTRQSSRTPGEALLRTGNNGRQCVTVDAEGHPNLRTFDKSVFDAPWCVLCVNQGDTLYIIWNSKQAEPTPLFESAAPGMAYAKLRLRPDGVLSKCKVLHDEPESLPKKEGYLH